jgi:hypothetical protein
MTFYTATPMSALGHNRTFRSAIAMSAIPPKADMGRGPVVARLQSTENVARGMAGTRDQVQAPLEVCSQLKKALPQFAETEKREPIWPTSPGGTTSSLVPR